ncbi:MAG: DCC1-like thiol-disulfide oxidoreductase family protein [Bacteriovoracaceae bacterium]|jgi:predicted DCC family thiol-disulfide oxidoreductase YuxK|nr:DCC1-like thiol-disulfide oxidoreductase family protein [Bacteriovoracaceae bacterium]
MEKVVLLYDSECSLCTRFKKALEHLDSESLIEYKSIYDQEVYLNYPQLNTEECQQEVHMIIEDGKVIRGGDVIEYLVKIFPGVSKFSWLIESESGKKAINVFYKKLNDMRLMKKRNCFTCGSKKR